MAEMTPEPLRAERLRILYEDNHLLVVEKPVNIPSQPDVSRDPDLLTMVRQYLKHRYHKPGRVYVGLIHRLDRPVGGVMLLARTSKAASRLSEQLRQHTIKKSYLGVVAGRMPAEEGWLSNQLLPAGKSGRSRVVGPGVADPSSLRLARAELGYQVVAERSGLSLVLVTLETGRKHQIRAQLAALGCPIHGDVRYGGPRAVDGAAIALWATELRFRHPTRLQELTITSEPPWDQPPWNRFRGVWPWHRSSRAGGADMPRGCAS